MYISNNVLLLFYLPGSLQGTCLLASEQILRVAHISTDVDGFLVGFVAVDRQEEGSEQDEEFAEHPH